MAQLSLTERRRLSAHLRELNRQLDEPWTQHDRDDVEVFAEVLLIEQELGRVNQWPHNRPSAAV